MITGVGRWLVPILKVPDTPPEPPLGTHDVLRVERAAPGYYKYLLLKWGVVGGLQLLIALILFGVMFIPDVPWPVHVAEAIGIALLVLGVVFQFLVLRMDYELRWYVITDRSLRIREGIWNVREITLTFANVQNVQVTQGPLERLFGVSDVVVETAGGGGGAVQPQAGGHRAALGHRGHLRGVANPHVLRDLIVELLKREKGAGLGDSPDDAPRAAPGKRGLSPSALAALREAAEQARELRKSLS